MRRISILLAAAAIVAVGLSTAPAQAYDGEHRGANSGWHNQGWDQHAVRERWWRRYDWYEHGRLHPRYSNYGYHAPASAYYAAPAIVQTRPFVHNGIVHLSL